MNTRDRKEHVLFLSAPDKIAQPCQQPFEPNSLSDHNQDGSDDIVRSVLMKQPIQPRTQKSQNGEKIKRCQDRINAKPNEEIAGGLLNRFFHWSSGHGDQSSRNFNT